MVFHRIIHASFILTFILSQLGQSAYAHTPSLAQRIKKGFAGCTATGLGLLGGLVTSRILDESVYSSRDLNTLTQSVCGTSAAVGVAGLALGVSLLSQAFSGKFVTLKNQVSGLKELCAGGAVLGAGLYTLKATQMLYFNLSYGSQIKGPAISRNAGLTLGVIGLYSIGRGIYHLNNTPTES